MADQSTKVVRKTRDSEGRDAFPIADGVTVYEGMLCGLEAGYINHWADGANDVFLGVVLGGKDRGGDGILLGETSDTPPPEAWVDTSGVILQHLDSVGGTPTQAKVGDLVYSLTSNPDDMTLTAVTANNHPIGILWRFRSATDVDVKLFTPAEMLAQATA